MGGGSPRCMASAARLNAVATWRNGVAAAAISWRVTGIDQFYQGSRGSSAWARSPPWCAAGVGCAGRSSDGGSSAKSPAVPARRGVVEIGVHAGTGKPVAGLLDERHITISCLLCAYIHGLTLLTGNRESRATPTFGDGWSVLFRQPSSPIRSKARTVDLDLFD
jgi:hypothetical protein